MEKGLLEDFESGSVVKYQWYLLVILSLEPIYLLLRKIHSLWIYKRDYDRALTFERLVGEKRPKLTRRYGEKESDRINFF